MFERKRKTTRERQPVARIVVAVAVVVEPLSVVAVFRKYGTWACVKNVVQHRPFFKL